MSLVEKKNKGSSEPRKRVSHVALWIQSLPESEASAAEDMLRDPEWTSSALLRAFQEEGLDDVKYSAFRSFRATNYPEGLSS